MDDGRFSVLQPWLYGQEHRHQRPLFGQHDPLQRRLRPMSRDMTEAEVGVRENVWDLIEFLQSSVPGFEDAYVQQTSPQVGPRESRPDRGRLCPHRRRRAPGHKFEDAIARGSWWIDIHCPLGHTYPVHLCIDRVPRQDECPFWAAEHDRACAPKTSSIRPTATGTTSLTAA